jgi:crotonobetainyl-CoA:carnitine CoA-transferase CaiB-like acyl-CoA transferase
MLAVGNHRQFRTCLDCVGLLDLASDPRFRSNADRVANRDELIEKLAAAFRRGSTAEWLQQLAAHGVPAGPINSIAEVLGDDYASERQLVRPLPHPIAGEVPTVANPVGFSATPVTYRLAPPLLGQHTMEILTDELGMGEEEIHSLAAAGIVELPS